MKQTVVGVFDRIDAARQAADSLGVSGFGPGSVLVTAASEDEAELGARGVAEAEVHDGGVIDSVRSFFAEVFGPGDWTHQHQQEYAEAVRRGAVVVKVEVHDEAHLEMARETLQSAGAVDIEERVAEWREEGWDGGAVPADAGHSIARMGGEDSSAAMRSVSHGGVRVYARRNGVPALQRRPEPAEGAAAGGRAALQPAGGPQAAQAAEGAAVARPAESTAAAQPPESTTAARLAESTAAAQRAEGTAAAQPAESTEAAQPAGAGEAPRVDALELLAGDHRAIRELFAGYERLAAGEAPGAERQALAERICVQLTVHAALEEEIFYPAARAALRPTQLVDEASVEHASARELIERIRAMQPDEELYDASVRVLGEYIDHHLREEEGELFPALRDSALDRAGLGLEMSDRKAELLAQFAQDLRV